MNTEKPQTATEQWYYALPYLTSDGICFINSDRTVIFANPQIEKILGYDPGTCAGKNLSELCDDTLCTHVKPLLKSGPGTEKRAFGIPFFTRSGMKRYADITIAPIVSDTGLDAGFVLVISDITALERAERKIDHFTRSLNLVSSVPRHDILNRIETIRGYLGLISRVNTDEKTGNRLNTMDSAADDIRNILAFTREYEKIGTLDPVWFDLSETFFQAVSRFVSNENVTFDCSCQGVSIFADPVFPRIFVALIENSILHGDGVTSISVSCDVTEGHLFIRYRDDGTGIADEDKKSIFTRRADLHHGYGLFLARDILMVTDITIREEGIPKKGVCFVMQVPKGGYRIFDEHSKGDGSG